MANKPPVCRYFNKPCLEHGCVQYVRLDGVDPQTGAPVNEFMCTDVALVKVMLETTLAVRRVDGEINAFRNETRHAQVRLIDATTRALESPP